MPHDAAHQAPLPRATSVLPAGSWAAEDARDSVTVDFDDRFRRRRRYVAAGGLAFLLDLADATVLRDGDGLLLEDGGVVLVRAAPEPLVEVTADTAAHLLRLAWHLGNRHLLAQLSDGRILIRDDHVITTMLRGLGANLRPVSAPFDPEGGAYGERERSVHQPFRHEGHAHGVGDHGHGDGHHHRHG